jgi:hypothetical protein
MLEVLPELLLETAILHRLFAFAVDSELVEKNPVRMDGRPGESPTSGAEPFTGDDLVRFRDHALRTCPHSCSFDGRDYAGRMRFSLLAGKSTSIGRKSSV